MASSLAFVQYIGDQLRDVGDITFRKMFGEYGMYRKGKLFALICDDRLYVKITNAGKACMPQLETAPPYDGAKPYFLMENIDDREALGALVLATCDELPQPKKKRIS